MCHWPLWARVCIVDPLGTVLLSGSARVCVTVFLPTCIMRVAGWWSGCVCLDPPAPRAHMGLRRGGLPGRAAETLSHPRLALARGPGGPPWPRAVGVRMGLALTTPPRPGPRPPPKEHVGVPGGGKHPWAGAPHAFQLLPAQQQQWRQRQLEEPGGQSLQWFLQLRPQRQCLWPGMWSRGPVGPGAGQLAGPAA